MKHLYLLVLVLLLNVFSGCKTGSITAPIPPDQEKVRVEIIDIPYNTETFLRVPYTISLWEYFREGLTLNKIEVLNHADLATLMTIEGEELPFVYHMPLPTNPYFTLDPINRCYLSIQLPLPLAGIRPQKLYHRFHLTDTLSGKTITVEGGEVVPRYNENPLVIASPVKGKNWLFINQSSMAYHFYVLFFLNGQIWYGERFAFDNIKLDDSFQNYFSGDPGKNESYFNYRDTLYAVAPGTIITVRDGRTENNGNKHDAPMSTIDELAGNYVTIDIGNGKYAFYAHCVPGSFFVKQGDVVNEGQPIALLGNSGNSDAPHLHFQINDGPDILFSRGVPYIWKTYTKLGEVETGPTSPVKINNAGSEENTVMSFN